MTKQLTPGTREWWHREQTYGHRERIDLPERIRDKATLGRVARIAVNRGSPRAARLLAECAEWALSQAQGMMLDKHPRPCAKCGKPNPKWQSWKECDECASKF